VRVAWSAFVSCGSWLPDDSLGYNAHPAKRACRDDAPPVRNLRRLTFSGAQCHFNRPCSLKIAREYAYVSQRQMFPDIASSIF